MSKICSKFAGGIKDTTMELFIELSAALLPAIALMVYIYWKDPVKEPAKELIRAAVLGATLCVPVALVEHFVQTALFGPNPESVSLLGTTVQAFFVAAIPEEAAKLFILWLVVRKNKYFDEHIDGIVYAVYVSLGFAAIENVFYVIGSENWLSVAVTRSLLAVPGHYAFAVLMGYYYSLYHFVSPTRKNAAMVLLMPVLAHGIYDALAMSGEANPVVGTIAFGVLIYFCIRMHRFAAGHIVALIHKDQNQPKETPTDYIA